MMKEESQQSTLLSSLIKPESTSSSFLLEESQKKSKSDLSIVSDHAQIHSKRNPQILNKELLLPNQTKITVQEENKDNEEEEELISQVCYKGDNRLLSSNVVSSEYFNNSEDFLMKQAKLIDNYLIYFKEAQLSDSCLDEVGAKLSEYMTLLVWYKRNTLKQT